MKNSTAQKWIAATFSLLLLGISALPFSTAKNSMYEPNLRTIPNEELCELTFDIHTYTDIYHVSKTVPKSVHDHIQTLTEEFSNTMSQPTKLSTLKTKYATFIDTLQYYGLLPEELTTSEITTLKLNQHQKILPRIIPKLQDNNTISNKFCFITASGTGNTSSVIFFRLYIFRVLVCLIFQLNWFYLENYTWYNNYFNLISKRPKLAVPFGFWIIDDGVAEINTIGLGGAQSLEDLGTGDYRAILVGFIGIIMHSQDNSNLIGLCLSANCEFN